MGYKMTVNGKTRLCGLIGNPVSHTMSPMIHNHLADRLHINNIYVPFHVETEELQQAIEGAHALNVLGMNVTVPYKTDVIPFLDEIDPMAKGIGAVNTLVRTEQGYKGYNTDMTGLCRAMQTEGIRLDGEEIIILGAGGASRSVAYMCLYYKVSKIYLLNRTVEKAQKIADELNEVFERDAIIPMSLMDFDRIPVKKYLVIQGTSIGLYPDSEACVIEDPCFYQLAHTGYDLIYRPFQTRFMEKIEEAGGVSYNGLGMLLFQAIDAFELWNHIEISDEVAMETYELLKAETKKA
ncbi:MAG: shikimate dehydrogenase [Lachnospiraceae bacterium]|nr:shikimate dehydrogenase [Lachnospiraceae bacterium]MDD3660837.1 shikimate dehydrogenase [Lachnospiraceae bacterium]